MRERAQLQVGQGLISCLTSKRCHRYASREKVDVLECMIKMLCKESKCGQCSSMEAFMGPGVRLGAAPALLWSSLSSQSDPPHGVGV